jgi:hypothetical protein
MTALQRAECLFDEAERETRAGKYAALSHRDNEAERHFHRVRECQQQGHSLLDQVILNPAGSRAIG